MPDLPALAGFLARQFPLSTTHGMAKSPRSQGSSSGNEDTPPFVDQPPRARPPAHTPDDEWSLDDGPAAEREETRSSADAAFSDNRGPQPIPAQPISPQEDTQSGFFESNREPVSSKPKDLPVRPSARIHPKAGESDDPFDMGGERLPELQRSAIPRGPAPEISEEEKDDFANAGKAVEPAAKAPRPAWERLTMIGACAATALTGVAVIWALLANGPKAEAAPSNRAPSLPMQGATATVSAAEAHWRLRRPEDRVSGIEVSLPAPERVESAILPEVKLTLDGSASRTGFLRISFLNAAREIAGDVRILKVVGGKFESMDRGEKVISPTEASVYGSIGFTDRLNYLQYTSGDSPRWYVDVRESADYNANEAGWKQLDAFDVSNVLKD